MGMTGQEWANMWPNYSILIIFIIRTFPQSVIKIWWPKIDLWKRGFSMNFWPNYALLIMHNDIIYAQLIPYCNTCTPTIIPAKFHKDMMNQTQFISHNVISDPIDMPPRCIAYKKRDFCRTCSFRWKFRKNIALRLKPFPDYSYGSIFLKEIKKLKNSYKKIRFFFWKIWLRYFFTRITPNFMWKS